MPSVGSSAENRLPVAFLLCRRLVYDHLDATVLLFDNLLGMVALFIANALPDAVQAAQMLIATAGLAYPDYEPAVWHVYLVYVAMMFFSYVVICMPTLYVSWFNIGATALGMTVLVITTIILPIKATELNSGRAIFTEVCMLIALPALHLTRDCHRSITRLVGLPAGRFA